MKIGIDARMLGTGFGIARYVQQLLIHLDKIDHENQYVLFLRQENWDVFEPTGNNFKKVLADIPWYGLAEQLQLPKIIKKENVDLMHFPHWNIPIFYDGPFVVTIHDLIMYHYKRTEASTHGPLIYWLKDKIHRNVINNAVKKAKKIITTTEFTKNDVNKTLKVPLDKMITTYQAPFETAQKVDYEETLKKFAITKPFVLYVGSAYPHKNLDGLVDAWTIFQEKYGLDYQLVLAGKENYFYKKLKTKIDELSFGEDILILNQPSDTELSALYSSASLYVFPSFYEGFGLPPLEAMSHDLPVISSNQSCLPEILNGAVEYFNPENKDEMADTMNKVLLNNVLRENLKVAGKNLLKKYSWDKLAQETLQIYLSVDKSAKI